MNILYKLIITNYYIHSVYLKTIQTKKRKSIFNIKIQNKVEMKKIK